MYFILDGSVYIRLRACVMGMHDYVTHIAAQISRLIHDDEHIASLTGCGFHLLTLMNGQAVLEPDKLGVNLEPLIQQCWRNALYMIPGLEGFTGQESDNAIQALRDLYAFSRQIGDSGDEFFAALQELMDNQRVAGSIRGAALGILFHSGRLSQSGLEQYLSRFLQQYQDQDLVLGIIYGLICSAREILWRVRGVLLHINQMVMTWPEDYFL
ncbi:MAG: DUF5682 family protein [Gammaproteobacteria bacterium]|nr:DUF5682 family protein [Gammaproteobacteria bacterium]